MKDAPVSAMTRPDYSAQRARVGPLMSDIPPHCHGSSLPTRLESNALHVRRNSKFKTIGKVFAWLVRLSVEVGAYFVAPYWIIVNTSEMLDNLLSPSYSIMTIYDPGPTIPSWDFWLYTGYNTTPLENEQLLRWFITQVDQLPRVSTVPLEIPVARIPFTLTLTRKTLLLQSVTKANLTADATSGRYSFMVGKSFTMEDPVFDPIESLVIYFRLDNKVHGYETLRVLKTVNANDTHQVLIDATESYLSLVGPPAMAFAIVLPPAIIASLIKDERKTNGKPDTPPSCTHPTIPNMVYSIMHADRMNYYCASDPAAISGLHAFQNWMYVTGIPTVPNQLLLSTAHRIPTGFRLPAHTTGFLDTTPNATLVMVPLMQIANNVWNGQTSHIDYIIQTQIGILVGTRLATCVTFLGLLMKFSWTSGRNLLLVLVDYFTLEVTNNSTFDMTVAITLVTTLWTYRDMILAMIVSRCLTTLPWNASMLHSYTDDLIFIPAPVCYVFVLGLCIAKQVLNSFRTCVRLVYVAIYLATVILVTGALTHQGPALTSTRSADPYTFYPTFVIPMTLFYFRTSPHLDSYFYMAWATVGAIGVGAVASQCHHYYRKLREQRQLPDGRFEDDPLSRYSSFDVAVGLAIRFPGGFMDPSRMYTQRERSHRVKSMVYSLAMSGYVEVDGCLMLLTSVNRCVAAYFFGSTVDTSGPIHYFMLSPDRKTVESRIYRTFPTHFIQNRPLWRLLFSLSLRELE
ncbi:hypothetical protein AeRB84_004483 [Aphanomyces euteiches]|nr:hypothetical protein AeRB84_004483 [Aphanomyces euteiches]